MVLQEHNGVRISDYMTCYRNMIVTMIHEIQPDQAAPVDPEEEIVIIHLV